MNVTCPECNDPSAFSVAGDGQVHRTVTLVHGTWAKHAPWMQLDAKQRDPKSTSTPGLVVAAIRLVRGIGRRGLSAWTWLLGDNSWLGRLWSPATDRTAAEQGPSLAGQLASLPGTVLFRFCWTGKNRHDDRITAATDLRAHLLKLVDDHPGAAHHVVAHSHGGNVALYALQDDEELAPHEQLRHRLSDTGGSVVTMATPFLHLSQRPGGLGALWKLWLAVALLLISALATVIGGLLIGEPNWQYWTVFAVAALGVFPLLLIVWSATRYRGRSVGRTTFLPFSGCNHGRAAEFKRLTPAALGPEELLVVRPMGDEAAGALVAAQFFSWLLARFLGLLNLVMGRIFVLVFVVVAVTISITAVVEDISVGAEGQLQGWFDVVMSLFVGFALSLVAVAALPALLLTIIAASAAGRDGLFLPLFVEMTVEAGPLGEARVHRADVSTKNGLSHSRIYEDQEVIAAIVDHLKRD
jgi:hypothetical protein